MGLPPIRRARQARVQAAARRDQSSSVSRPAWVSRSWRRWRSLRSKERERDRKALPRSEGRAPAPIGAGQGRPARLIKVGFPSVKTSVNPCAQCTALVRCQDTRSPATTRPSADDRSLSLPTPLAKGQTRPTTRQDRGTAATLTRASAMAGEEHARQVAARA